MTVLFSFMGTIIGHIIGSALAVFAFRMYIFIQTIRARDANEHGPVEVEHYDEILETPSEIDDVED